MKKSRSTVHVHTQYFWQGKQLAVLGAALSTYHECAMTAISQEQVMGDISQLLQQAQASFQLCKNDKIVFRTQAD